MLVRTFGDIGIAEDAVQDAFEIALTRWPRRGAPPNPVAWIITTARNRAVDRLRRESSRPRREADAAFAAALENLREDAPDSVVPDERLRLAFTCCHPALGMSARVALTLRLIGGLSTLEIARAFLVSEATMAQRLVRAKAKIRDARIPYRIPGSQDLQERLTSVLAVVYLVFNEGYAPSVGPDPVRASLCAEAIRLGRQLVALMPDEPEVIGLLALMLLTDARREARFDPDGQQVLLADQDRALWNSGQLAEGLDLVRRCLRMGRPGSYQIQAAINAVHSGARSLAETDWSQILRLYDQLLVVQPGPVVELNRAIVVAEIDGPAAGLAEVERLDLDTFALAHAVRADLLRRLERIDESLEEYSKALPLTGNPAELGFLERRIEELGRSR